MSANLFYLSDTILLNKENQPNQASGNDQMTALENDQLVLPIGYQSFSQSTYRSEAYR